MQKPEIYFLTPANMAPLCVPFYLFFSRGSKFGFDPYLVGPESADAGAHAPPVLYKNSPV